MNECGLSPCSIFCLLFQVDFLERAKRLEEIPLLEQDWEEQQVQAKEFWEQQEKQRVRFILWTP